MRGPSKSTQKKYYQAIIFVIFSCQSVFIFLFIFWPRMWGLGFQNDSPLIKRVKVPQTTLGAVEVFLSRTFNSRLGSRQTSLLSRSGVGLGFKNEIPRYTVGFFVGTHIGDLDTVRWLRSIPSIGFCQDALAIPLMSEVFWENARTPKGVVLSKKGVPSTF